MHSIRKYALPTHKEKTRPGRWSGSCFVVRLALAHYKKPALSLKGQAVFYWCRGPESNRYGYLYPRDFKSRASASSATSAEGMEATPGIEPGIKVLQTSALPLGYSAGSLPLGYAARVWITIPADLWSGLRGANSLPPPWQGGALPSELNPQMVPSDGIEPSTRGFSVLCSTN